MATSTAAGVGRDIGRRAAIAEWIVAVTLVAGFAGACSAQQAEQRPTTETDEKMGAPGGEQAAEPPQPEAPKRIILLIGDGMGTASLSAATYAGGRPLAMTSMPELNFITTHSHEFVTTDSAASATAFATGHKTHYQGVSVKPGTTEAEEEDPANHLETLLEVAEGRGWKTGLVANVRITHATPAAFAAHRSGRNSYEAIARDMSESEVDVLLGGGRQYFTDRTDGANLIEKMKRDGRKVARTADEIRAASGVAERLVGLIEDKDLPALGEAERSMGLPEMTRSAIEILDRGNDEGYFLMVEGSQIDWEGHDLDGPSVVEETREFDRAVREALQYARGRDDTLVVTVADHETGGLSLFDSEDAGAYLEALGGAEKVERQADYAQDVGATPPRAVESVEMKAGPSSGPVTWADWADRRFNTMFGHLAMESRSYVTNPDEFWGLHTPELIPMWSEGPGSKAVIEAKDNAAVGRRLHRLIDGEIGNVGADSNAEGGPGAGPQNVILYVGDGFGFDALTAGHYARGGLGLRDMPSRGLAATHATDRLVGDGASTATALMTGRRTRRGAVATAPGDGGELESVATILEQAEQTGRRTGIVTTGRLTDESVAALYGHHEPGAGRKARSEAFVGLGARLERGDGPEVAFGGGGADFGTNQRKKLRADGADVESTWGNWPSPQQRTVRLLAPGPLTAAPARSGDDGRPTLAEMTRTAVERLSHNGEPFLLVVEADGIGRLQRQFDRSRRLADAVAEFDRGVEVGLDYARDHGRTLVVATGDQDTSLSVLDNHYGFSAGICQAAKRCGGSYELNPVEVPVDQVPEAPGFGATELQGEFGPPTLFLQYAWPAQKAGTEAGEPGRPTAHFMPVYAYGPWSEKFEGMIEQPSIGRALMTWASR